jgi:hypothetical protein
MWHFIVNVLPWLSALATTSLEQLPLWKAARVKKPAQLRI